MTAFYVQDMRIEEQFLSSISFCPNTISYVVFNYLSAADIVLQAVKGFDAVAACEHMNMWGQDLMISPLSMPMFNLLETKRFLNTI
jgi:hypothetical protein